MEKVNLENYEEYIMLYIDGELNKADEKDLIDFLKKYPEKQQELDAFETVKLIPDTSQVYEGKESLLKKSAPIIISFKQWWLYGAAAGIIAIIFLMNFQKWMNNDSHIESNVKNVAYQQQTKPTTSKIETVPTNNNIHTTPKPIQKTNQIAIINIPQKPNQQAQKHLATAEIQPIKAIQKTVALPDEKTKPALLAKLDYEPQNITIQQPENFIDKLPISQEKKEGLLSLKENVSNRIEQAKTFKNSLKDTEVALKIGNNQLFVINL